MEKFFITIIGISDKKTKKIMMIGKVAPMFLIEEETKSESVVTKMYEHNVTAKNCHINEAPP